jgi:hypothetical protein
MTTSLTQTRSRSAPHSTDCGREVPWRTGDLRHQQDPPPAGGRERHALHAPLRRSRGSNRSTHSGEQARTPNPTATSASRNATDRQPIDTYCPWSSTGRKDISRMTAGGTARMAFPHACGGGTVPQRGAHKELAACGPK